MSMIRVAVVFLLAALATPAVGRAQDLGAEAWPGFDIWIKMDEDGNKRIYILNSYASEPNQQYEETALGVSWDQRLHRNWSWRAGVRYIWKAVDPPDKNETRVVLDLTWSHLLGRGWVLSDRNRLDLRHFAGDSTSSFRYRNRLMLSKPFPILGRAVTGFGSYETYYDSRFDAWGQRQRIIAGVSVPITKWLSVDIFPGYHIETQPKRESAAALGVAFGLYFP
jgi:hypothetical protein